MELAGGERSNVASTSKRKKKKKKREKKDFMSMP